MTKIELAKYAQVLEAKEAELVLKIHRPSIVERSPDELDVTRNIADQHLEVEIISRMSDLLAAVRVAKDRVRDGDFGVCVDCEGDISPKRIKVLPWASRCVRCQEATDEMERQPTLSVATA